MKFSLSRFPIKTKLTVATLIPLAIGIVFCFLAGIFIVNTKMSGQAQEKAKTDLNVAREALRQELSRVNDVVRFTAALGATAPAIDAGDRTTLATLLGPVRQAEHLDLLTAVDAYGKVVFRAANPLIYGDLQNGDQYVARALKGEVAAGATVIPVSRLALEGGALTQRAKVVAGADTVVAGLFLKVAVPVRAPSGTVVGAMCGGVLLNNNNALLEKIKTAVYEGAGQRKEVGAANLFFGKVRIAGAGPATANYPAGEKLPDEIYRSVLLGDNRTVERTFVSNDWYLTAYDPIRSLQGVPLGALYLGMQESNYSTGRSDLNLLLCAVVFLSLLIGVSVSGVLGSRLARPVKELSMLAKKLAAGERNVQSNIDSRDEIGDLAGSFNEMSRALNEREERIIELNRDLEKKVEQRTAELEENNRLLLQTKEELLRVEKLAAIGELAAGVAHEINNPMAIIRGNTELLQLSIDEDDPNREEVETIFAQVKRVERIVTNLLKFARRERREQGTVQLNGLLKDILAQIGHQESLDGIELEERFSPKVALVSGDSGQLHQVFTNLILNAVQAMPAGGTLTVETLPGLDEETFQVCISDTGVGIPAENVNQIFNPFFTTKTTGTGLGLSVSYGIVKEHGGTIEVTSRPGFGTSFSVILPI
ncbi:ATP-binding protein [Geomonas sp. Red32]|uniref:ATP-binding protein n=1 Tax=Geomonas sp. Red32 TaxID=2912856 RepID=UPI00202CC730|nr:ATP-binding protein [Geomonas sp. Red32]MCM0082725.1 ATP-binding protein [Geomonas sp. Red32]